MSQDLGIEIRDSSRWRGYWSSWCSCGRNRTKTGEIVDVIEAVSEIGSNLHPQGPYRKIGEARVLSFLEAISEAGAGNKLVDEVNAASRTTINNKPLLLTLCTQKKWKPLVNYPHFFSLYQKILFLVRLSFGGVGGRRGEKTGIVWEKKKRGERGEILEGRDKNFQ